MLRAVGYDLWFWRYGGADRPAPRSVQLALSEGEAVAAVTRFPIRRFLTALDTAWAGREREVNHPRFRAYRFSESAVVEVAWSDGHVRVTLRPFDQALANDVIEAAGSVDAPLYDPQLDRRFDGPDDG
jgi:hypothetical protein